MFSTGLTQLGRALGLDFAQGRRRKARAEGRFGMETERMESRALLSASSCLNPVSAEVGRAVAKATFSYPQVDGLWKVTGDATGDAKLTQTKNKVTATITATDMGIEVTAKGKFTKANPHNLIDTVKVTNPTGIGPKKLKVNVNIDFGEGSVGQRPTSFDGTVAVSVPGFDEIKLVVKGTKNG